MKQIFFTNSGNETKKIGEKIAKEILKNNFSNKNAFLIGLRGELGGGKTTFMQGFAKGLGAKDKVLSPTFVLVKKFKIPKGKIKYLYHIDCYRLNNEKDLLDLGFKEMIPNPENIVVVEWADKIKKIMPKKSFWIIFEFISENKRKIIVDNFFSI